MKQFVVVAFCVLICVAGAGLSLAQDTPKANQVWDVSKDGGKHFKTIFDGLYTRKR